MKLSKIWLLGFTAVILVVGVVVIRVNTTQASPKAANVPPLIDSPDDIIAKAAIDYTAKMHAIVSGTPQVLLNRKTTVNDIQAAGLGIMGVTYDQPPMQLVVLKGDFEGSALLPGARTQLRVEYIAYILDLASGRPLQVNISTHGGAFRKLLNDPTLPDDNPEAAKITPDQHPFSSMNGRPTVSNVGKCAYGSTVLGVPMTPPANK